jgi:hypothetical protein
MWLKRFLKILRKSIDKKALRQGRHFLLLFPLPKIMLFNEKSLRKTRFLSNLCVIFGVTLGLVKLHLDGLIYIVDSLHILGFSAIWAKILHFWTCGLNCTALLNSSYLLIQLSVEEFFIQITPFL